ncbi:hypothetical protein GQ55_6G005700 [Panicum hallii var. hallii]|uniref:Uncharacterized protein n=1 Tax=Panicum hallii var. hallii TaxID=1504633 RepID=A0A2T7D2M4_9POAL|nr:hypothetical protein GQ55_6G005700 [Panicum hallii var. hallii]
MSTSFSFRCTVTANFWVISMPSFPFPPGTSQSKWYKRFASMISREAIPKFRPGQILRPEPNGIMYPSTSQSAVLRCGRNSGPGGCSRRVSLMTAFR